MKKFLSMLLAAVMLLGCLPVLADEPAEFPALDGSAAWDYIGDWFGVSGLDVMDEPTTDYPELKLCLYLNGLGDLYLDGGKKEVVGWYVEDETVFLARTVDKVPQADQIFAYAYKNETGRLVVNLGDCSVICEQEGEEYLDVTWPEFDAEDAQYFIGAWEAVTYISEEVEVPAEAGDMILVLNDDGTALSIEAGEEPYELRWYSDYAVAYIGETPAELAEISFDGNGNISVKMDEETTIIMAPTVYEETVETGTILGTWESSDRTVEITEDGKLTLIYKEDGYTNHMQWEIVDGIPTVTLGTWQGSTIEFVDGYLIINYSVQQKLTRVGPVPDIYVGPGGFAVSEDDPSGAFIGDWNEESGRGVLTFRADFTATMNFTDGRVYDFNWKTTDDGAIFTSGMWFDTPMVIENGDTLNIGGGWMILYRDGAEAAATESTDDGAAYEDEMFDDEMSEDEMSEEEFLAFLEALAELAEMEEMEEGEASDLPAHLAPFVGTWHLVYISTAVMEGDPRTMNLPGTFDIYADGTAEMSGFSSASGDWYEEDGAVRFGEYGVLLQLLDGGFLQHGTELSGMMIFSQDETAVYTPGGQAAVSTAPEAPAAPAEDGEVRIFTSNEEYLEVPFTATTYTTYGETRDAAELGVEYSILFYADGTCDFVFGGVEAPALNWGLDQVSMGLTKIDAFVVTYYTMTYNFIPTETGFDMDYFGTMTLHFVPAEVEVEE